MTINIKGKNLFSEILKIHLKSINNIDFKNRKKIIVCFSAVPCSGKTYISKLIEKRYSAIRINNDEIRKIISRLYKEKNESEREEILKKYLIYFITYFKTLNGIIILDSSIDRKYDIVEKIAKKKGFHIFIIGIKANTKTLRERIAHRSKKDIEHFNSRIKDWILDNKRFNLSHKVDVLIDNNGELNKKIIFNKLGKIIK